MDNTVENQLKNVMSAVFEVPVNQINDDSSPETIESWDSLKHMNLIVALEEEFSITFSDQQIFEMINLALIIHITTESLENQ